MISASGRGSHYYSESTFTGISDNIYTIVRYSDTLYSQLVVSQPKTIKHMLWAHRYISPSQFYFSIAKTNCIATMRRQNVSDDLHSTEIYLPFIFRHYAEPLLTGRYICHASKALI